MKRNQSGNGSYEVQGEGDYDAARRYRKGLKSYMHSADVEAEARRAAPENIEDEQAMERAERQGRGQSRGEDPGSTNDATGRRQR